ncbi:MAG TPA: adenine phosphoribosyltransferase [Candidatus Brocadiia bacterium]|nr:adenine phosphoribosyltransferase [Candidatus Brocadiia bacterium]
MMDLKSVIREVPDFPKKGILFFDVSTLFQNAKALDEACEAIAGHFRRRGVDVVAGIESRGFVVGSIVANKLGAGFVMLRKPGKLPYKTVCASYSLEYGSNTLCMHVDAVKPGQKVLLVDDLLATGGTLKAARELVEGQGGKVLGSGVIVELDFLPGRKTLEPMEVFSLVHYASEKM